MKKIFNLYPYIMVLLGSFLETYFYYFRFDSVGWPSWVAIIASVALTVSLTYLATKWKDNRYKLLIIIMAAFSIFSTSTGQAFSVGVIEQSKVVSNIQQINIQDEIDEIKIDIEFINNEIQKISESNTANTTWSRNKYAESVAKSEERQNELTEEKKNLQSKLSELRSNQTVHIEVETEDRTNTYKIYNELMNINVKWLEFILQVVLSIFFALMAPLGLIMVLSNNQKSKQKPEQPTKTPEEITDSKITLFVKICWSWITRNKSDLIVDYKSFDKIMANRKIQKKTENLVSTEEYKIMFNILLKNNFIDNNGSIIYTGSIDSVINLLKNKIKR